MRCRRFGWSALMRSSGISIRTKSALWAFPPEPNCPRQRRFNSRISTKRTVTQLTLLPALLPGPISSVWFIPGHRLSLTVLPQGQENPPIPRNCPPAFIVCGGSGDRVHAIWADEYLAAMLQAGIPNVEMHMYGNGRHPGDPMSDGTRMTGGLTAKNGIPFGTWQDRFIDWFRDLGFLQKTGVETKAARDIAAFLTQPPPRNYERRNTKAEK